MPIYVGSGGAITAPTSTSISLAAGTDTLRNSGLTTYSGNTFAFITSTDTPGFVAGSASDPGWQGFSNVWGKVNGYCTTTTYNKGNYYNTSTTRFTAPVSGPYLFVWTCYCYSSNYFHPQFWVNGGENTRRYNTPYRIRGYGFLANYQQDAQIEEVINLVAGDYVEVYHYAGGTAYYYPYYGLFGGTYVG